MYELSDRIYGMVDGEVVYEGTPDEAEDTGRVKELLTIQ